MGLGIRLIVCFARADLDMDDHCATPRGELILRTAAMPADTNANGDIFGGWILSQMDIAVGSCPRRSPVRPRSPSPSIR